MTAKQKIFEHVLTSCLEIEQYKTARFYCHLPKYQIICLKDISERKSNKMFRITYNIRNNEHRFRELRESKLKEEKKRK